MQISRGKIQGAQKVVVYGPEGIGKSTFASRFPNTIFIDTEGSTKHMDVARTPKPSSWTMLIQQVKYFKQNPHLLGTLALDTADWAEQLCMDHICAKADKQSIEDFGYGKGYIYLTEELGRLLNLLEELVEIGINVVVTAHAQMRKFEQPDEMGGYDRWELKLQKKTAPLLKEWADMVLFANYKTFVVKNDDKKNKAQGGKRVMYTTHHPCWDAKNRHNLAMELPFDFIEIAHCIITRENNQQPVQQQQPIQQSSPPKVETPPVAPPSTTQEPPKEQPQQQVITVPLAIKPPKATEPIKEDLSGVPKALADLMLKDNVKVGEIKKAVASKGYYPANTPIENYDAGFISGVLVAAWPQVFEIIQHLREDDIPF